MKKAKKSNKPISRPEFSEIQRQANEGSATHQNQLGEILALGRFGPVNKPEAVKYFRLAAKGGDPGAIWNLARYLMDDPEGPRDDAQAMEVLSLGCDQGYPFILNQVGYFYQHGIHVGQNLEKALELYRRAAEMGYPQAQFNLGSMYCYGHGVEQNEFEAFGWIEKAAGADFDEAIRALGEFLVLGVGCLQDVDRGLELLNACVGRNNPTAMFSLGCLYENGEILGQDYAKARFYLDRAIKLGFLPAFPVMAHLLENGLGGPKDLENAKRFYQTAAQKGLPGADEAYLRFLEEHEKSGESAPAPGTDPSKKLVH
ncbi:MAG: sel1 repeat family protein [Deltaproteobacteria bacterium]|jgi:TPR repeat protein|nr:sel1 repeat family protein [Deltaproteobacteria bacterium]